MTKLYFYHYMYIYKIRKRILIKKQTLTTDDPVI